MPADDGAALNQQVSQERAVAPRLVRAVAADREIRPGGERGKQANEALCGRLAHLAAIAPNVGRPALVGPLLRQRPRDEPGAWGHFGKPQIK